MAIELEQDFTLIDGSNIKFSVFDNHMLFMHGDFTSSQMVLKDMGINTMSQGEAVQLQFYLKGGENYISWFFQSEQEHALRLYFQKLGYYMTKPTVLS